MNAFHTLYALRRARQNRGGFTVHRVTRSGAPSQVAVSDHTGQSEFTQEQAQAFKARLEQLNPGRAWVVLPA